MSKKFDEDVENLVSKTINVKYFSKHISKENYCHKLAVLLADLEDLDWRWPTQKHEIPGYVKKQHNDGDNNDNNNDNTH